MCFPLSLSNRMVDQPPDDDPKPPQDTTALPTPPATPDTPAAPATPAPQSSTHPVAEWFHKLIHGTDPAELGIERARDVLLSVGRGAVSAVTEGVNTIGETAAFIDRKTGLGEKLEPGYNAEYDDFGAAELASRATAPMQDLKTRVFGKKTDDPLANFAESASQFAVGFAGAGQLKLLKASMGRRRRQCLSSSNSVPLVPCSVLVSWMVRCSSRTKLV